MGGAAGLAAGALGVYAASARYPAFRGLTLPFRAFLIVSSGTFACTSYIHQNPPNAKSLTFTHSHRLRRLLLPRLRKSPQPREAVLGRIANPPTTDRIQQIRLPARPRLGKRQPLLDRLRIMGRLHGRRARPRRPQPLPHRPAKTRPSACLRSRPNHGRRHRLARVRDH